MADPKQPAPPKLIEAIVVANYGQHLVGSLVRVTEAEYRRLREPDGAGGHRFPVLITQADRDTLAAKIRDAEAKAREVQMASDADRATSEGWAEYQRMSSEILAAARIQEQQRQHAMLTGAPIVEDPEAVRKRFEENVRAGRGL